MIDVAIIGAGPVGLACALEAQRAGLTAVVVEKGALVNSVVGYPHQMEFFSTPELLEIGAHPFPTAHYKPRREDGLDYYRRVAQAENLALRLYERVTGLTGTRGDFRVLTDRADRPPLRARHVIVATGFFDVPNRLDIPGEDLPHVSAYYREPYAHVGQRGLVIGAKNSAAKAALALARAGADVTLIIRGAQVSDSVKYWIRPDLLNRIAEGRIGVRYESIVTAIRAGETDLLTLAGPETLPADFVYALIGYQPDYAFLAALGVPLDEVDPAAPPAFDPTTHQTTRPGLYVAGTVCGGRATSRWFIENGRHHAQLIAAHIAGGA
ncbi:MAG: YpdA family putative bacillithiol disulfide reductase [Hymenobacteraceae bacterium]|nr:YpdA family putative bacillithiol disulfide reductase [Hymenobacteraceae bacterium]